MLDVSAVLAIMSNSIEVKRCHCPIVFTAVEFKLQNYTTEERSFSTAVKLLTLRKWQNIFLLLFPSF